VTNADENTAPSAWIGGMPYRLWRANQGVNRRLTESIADLGVTVTQLGIVVHLDELGHMSASDLARLFGLTPQSVSTALGQLEKLGWVTRIPHPVHKRVIWYEVTEAGAEAAVHGRERVATVNQEVTDALGDDRDAFESGLASLQSEFGEDMPYVTMWPLPGWNRPNRPSV
jgi:DNA-binding MarR family transcriptional regulator